LVYAKNRELSFFSRFLLLMHTPVLLIHFNRPDSTRRQLEALKVVAPQRVWVLCDGVAVC
jgi:hypothetical protein